MPKSIVPVQLIVYFEKSAMPVNEEARQTLLEKWSDKTDSQLEWIREFRENAWIIRISKHTQSASEIATIIEQQPGVELVELDAMMQPMAR